MAAVIAAAFTWWLDTSQSVAGNVADSPGVDRKVDGLNILDAYLVPGATSGGFTVVGALVISSGGPDRLVDVSVGEHSAVGLSRAVPRTATTAAGLPVGSDLLVKIGPEPGASHITVTGDTRPAAAGSFVTATFNFARRGPISLHLPVWASVSGPAGPDSSTS